MALWKGLALLIVGSLQVCLGSYLGYPRIHFAGRFRADSNTRNNMPCNYDLKLNLSHDTNLDDWGYNGTNDWQFFETKVTLAVYNDGSNSTLDPVVGRGIVGNLERPFAKLVDLDVDCQDHSTVYGLKFGVSWSDGLPTSPPDLAFYGNWTRSVVAETMWPRLKCYSKDHYYPQQGPKELYEDSFPYGAQGTTRITDIDWGENKNSRVLQELKQASGGGNLAVRVSLFYYTRNYPPYVRFNATLGYVVGVIGVPSPDDTLNIPGNRVMTATKNYPEVIYDDPNDLCYNQTFSSFRSWMNDAPLEVDYDNHEVRFDLSNSVPVDLNNTIREFGILHLGILLDDDNCVYLLGNEEGIHYHLTKEELNITSGIYTITFDPSLMDKIANNSLVIVQYLEGDSGKDTKICGEPNPASHTARILLKESAYFIRAKGYFVDRLERNYNPSSTQTLYVTRYGKPAANVGVLVNHTNSSAGITLPLNGVSPTSLNGVTNEDGLVDFVFEINQTIPKERHYGNNVTCKFNHTVQVTSLPIGGQVYYFTYRVNSVDGVPIKCTESKHKIVFLAFSDFENKSSYTWVDDVGPILSQYARVSRVMSLILNMSSYHNVTLPHNIQLMKYALSLDFENPSYMPTTRDLSTAKRNMILEWLENPIYDSKGSKPPHDTPQCIPPKLGKAIPPAKSMTHNRCNASEILFNDHPRVLDKYYEEITKVTDDTIPVSSSGHPIHRICTHENLLDWLQMAVQLEWATIPTYLTSLYSIVDGCNTEIYGIIRSVVMQEMLHFTQSANTLIAMGVTPVIDNASITPSFPTRLPGGVLPNLVVTLEKLSLEYVRRVFMGIELPEKSDVANEHIKANVTTIGSFYEDISDCIRILGNKYFNPSTVDKQVKWPWNDTEKVGSLVPVVDDVTAMKGIEVIISQGEGAGLLDPMDITNNTLAHFFKFEEIVCQNKLEQVSDDHYAYSGAFIPFQADGVWPMRDNPSIHGILPHTNCYTESRAFHQVYRALLRKLQEAFGGSPEKIREAIAIMESLQVHAKKLMWTKYRPDSEEDTTTCGPVWDYHWPEN